MAEDSRVTAVREYLDSDRGLYTGSRKLLGPLLEYAEERLRVNVGLVRDNADLRAKQRQPETLDLSSVTTADLLRELERRCSA